MLKQTIMFAAVAGMVFALATPAQAWPLSDPSLLAYWSFDDNTFTDNSANSYDGYAVGSPAFSNDVPATLGGGKSLDGTGGGGMGVADGGDFNIDEISVCFWIKGTPSGSWVHAITKGKDDSWGWMYRTRGEWNLGTEGAGRIKVGIGYNAAEWNHLVLTYKPNPGGEFKAYRNFDQATASGTPDGPIGNVDGSGNPFPDFKLLTGNGDAKVMLDEVYIFNRVLTPDEVLTMFELPEPASALLLLIGAPLLALRRRRR